MNVIGIVQTDLNEFNILFDDAQENGNQQGQGHNQGQQRGHNQNQSNGGDEDDDLFSFLTTDSSDDQDQQQRQGSGRGQEQNQQGQNLQEMTVRIKGIPEGQKATFLQMYQVIQDAKQAQDLEQNLTIVSNGSDQQGQEQKKNQRGSEQGQPGQMK